MNKNELINIFYYRGLFSHSFLRVRIFVFWSRFGYSFLLQCFSYKRECCLSLVFEIMTLIAVSYMGSLFFFSSFQACSMLCHKLRMYDCSFCTLTILYTSLVWMYLWTPKICCSYSFSCSLSKKKNGESFKIRVITLQFSICYGHVWILQALLVFEWAKIWHSCVSSVTL